MLLSARNRVKTAASNLIAIVEAAIEDLVVDVVVGGGEDVKVSHHDLSELEPGSHGQTNEVHGIVDGQRQIQVVWHEAVCDYHRRQGGVLESWFRAVNKHVFKKAKRKSGDRLFKRRCV